jgi:hypothetical protein
MRRSTAPIDDPARASSSSRARSRGGHAAGRRLPASRWPMTRRGRGGIRCGHGVGSVVTVLAAWSRRRQRGHGVGSVVTVLAAWSRCWQRGHGVGSVVTVLEAWSRCWPMSVVTVLAAWSRCWQRSMSGLRGVVECCDVLLDGFCNVLFGPEGIALDQSTLTGMYSSRATSEYADRSRYHALRRTTGRTLPVVNKSDGGDKKRADEALRSCLRHD